MNWYLRRRVSDALESWAFAYWSVQKLRYWKIEGDRLARPKTSLVIEGYPRCANSFAVRAFRVCNDPKRQMHIATHFHSPVQIALAVRWQIPTIVLIRNPDDAVLSQLALMIQSGSRGFGGRGKLKEKELFRLVSYYTRRFARFYEYLRPMSGQFVASDFTETTTSYSTVLERLNKKYQTSFKNFDHTKENVENIFRSSGPHLSPSEERNEIKDIFRAEYLAKRNKPLRDSANRAYQDFKKLNGLIY